jgi:hypothetical protein
MIAKPWQRDAVVHGEPRLKSSCIENRPYPALAVAVAISLAACASPPPERPLPPGPTAAELSDFATAEMHRRVGAATGNADEVIAADDTLMLIPRELLSRQNPPLFAAKLVCERYQTPAAVPRGGPPVASAPFSLAPQVAFACRDVDWRYQAEIAAIRSNLAAKVEAADRATLALAAPTRP